MLKVYVFKVAVTAISVVAVAGADQMWQAGAGVVLSLPGERKLQRSQNTQIALLITKLYFIMPIIDQQCIDFKNMNCYIQINKNKKHLFLNQDWCKDVTILIKSLQMLGQPIKILQNSLGVGFCLRILSVLLVIVESQNSPNLLFFTS